MSRPSPACRHDARNSRARFLIRSCEEAVQHVRRTGHGASLCQGWRALLMVVRGGGNSKQFLLPNLWLHSKQTFRKITRAVVRIIPLHRCLWNIPLYPYKYLYSSQFRFLLTSLTRPSMLRSGSWAELSTNRHEQKGKVRLYTTD